MVNHSDKDALGLAQEVRYLREKYARLCAERDTMHREMTSYCEASLDGHLGARIAESEIRRALDKNIRARIEIDNEARRLVLGF